MRLAADRATSPAGALAEGQVIYPARLGALLRAVLVAGQPEEAVTLASCSSTADGGASRTACRPIAGRTFP